MAEELTIRDPGHRDHLTQELRDMRSNGQLFDFAIQGQNQQSFRIHSVVLASVCPVFKRMLLCRFPEASEKTASFPNIPDATMEHIIDYAYNGTCNITNSSLMDLVKAAHVLDMSKLLRLCEPLISAVIHPRNCFSWFRIAQALGLDGVLQLAAKMLPTAIVQIAVTEEYKDLEKGDVVGYLQQAMAHGAYCHDVLRAAMEWIRHKPLVRKEHTTDLLGVVRVDECSDLFLAGVIRDNIDLFDNQQHACMVLLTKVLDADKSIVVVGGQSTSNVPCRESLILRPESSQLESFNEISDRDFTVKPFHSVCQIPDGMMLTGGDTTDRCVVFIMSLKLWVKQAPMRAARFWHGSGCTSGKVFVISGRVPSTDDGKSVDFMDLETKSWHRGPPLDEAELAPKIVVFGATLFVLLGNKRSLYQLDLADMSWSAKSPLPKSSVGCSVASSEHNIYVAGGDNNVNYAYAPATDVWCRLSGPSVKDRYGALLYYRYKLYLFAGCGREENLREVEEYDIGADRWSLTPVKLPASRWLHAAFLVTSPK